MSQRKIKREKNIYLEKNKNGSALCQNLWDAENTILRGKLRAMNSYIKKKEKSQNKQSNFILQGNGKRRKS